MASKHTRKRLKLMIISDGTGNTATATARAAMKQFPQDDIYFTRYKNIRSLGQVEAIFQEAAPSHDFVVYTVVQKEVREAIAKLSRKNHIRSFDLLGPMLTLFSNFFDSEPQSTPGLLHEVNEKYFERVNAMEFTLNHDDGRNLKSFHLADTVLIGISRTSKTPLSLYLSLHGVKVVNIPLIYNTPLPEGLKKIDQRKIIGLTIDPNILYKIRKNRLKKLGLNNEDGDYASMDKVIKEVEWANEVFNANKQWPVFNVSGKALEDTASDIMRLIQMRKNNIFKSKKNKKGVNGDF